VLLGETAAATTLIEIFGQYGLIVGKSSHEIVSGYVANTTAASACVAGAGTYEIKSLWLSVYTGATAPTDPTTFNLMDGNLVAATQVLTFTGIAVADETITIGTRVYTWKAAPGATDEITVGANQAASEANLTTAINTGPQGGGAANAQVTAVDGAGIVTLTAITAGSAGNAIATTETMTNASFGAATLTGGNDGTELSHYTLAGTDAVAQRYFEAVMLFEPVLRLTLNNALFVKLDNAPGAGGFFGVSGQAWIL
jgi:hypothetical protein